ncbi:MAG: hypothetical protein AAB393_06470, partial [Bacteroidota bacterium]
LVPGLFIGFVTHVLLFLFVVEGYYHVDRSVTLAILETVLRGGPNGATGTEIRARHEISYIIEDRVNTLQENGYLVNNGRSLELTHKGTAVAITTLFSTGLFRSQLQKDRVE